VSARDERVRDLFYEDQTAAGSPNEEGMARRVGNDLVVFLGGQVRSLTSGALPTPTEPCVILYSEDGTSFEQVVPLDFLTNDDGELIYRG